MSNSNSNQVANSNNANSYLQQALSLQMLSGKGNSLMQFILLTFQNQLQSLGDVVVDKLKKEVTHFKWFDGFSLVNYYIYRLYRVLYKLWYPIRNVLPFLKTKPKQLKTDDDFCVSYLKTIILSEAQSYVETSIEFQKSFWTYISSEQHRDNFKYNIKKVVSVRQIDNLTVEANLIYNDITLDIPIHDLQIEFRHELDVKLVEKYQKSEIQSVNGSDLNLLTFEKFEPINESDLHIFNFVDDPNSYRLDVYYTLERYITNSRVIEKIKHLVHVIDSYEKGEKFWKQLVDEKSFLKKYFFRNGFNYVYFDFKTEKDKIEDCEAQICLFPPSNRDDIIKQRKYFSIIFSCFISEIFNEDGSIKLDKSLLKPHCQFKNYVARSSFFFFGLYLKSQDEELNFDFNNFIDEFLTIHGKNSYSPYLSIAAKFKEFPMFNNGDNWKIFINHLFYICGYEPIYTIDASQDKASGNSIGVIIKSGQKMEKQAILQKFYQFLDSLNKTKSTNKKVQTFDIKMSYEEKVTKTLNPDYELYLKKLEEISKLPASEATTKAKNDCINSMPAQFLEEKKWVKEVKCLRINEVAKDLSKLYLSKDDKSKLVGMLNSFRDDKESLEELGLPNKLCVLLYGQPGCGKSSTIETVATYLQKDIYNLNLKSVRSNEDLTALWDYITHQTANGGCIVMEDIDASTNVILTRNKYTVNEDFTTIQPLTPNETPLSLSTVLNILQGSLQRDDSVVIVTTNWIEKLDSAFTRDMRFDVLIDMKPADHDQIKEIFQVYFKNRKCPIKLIETIPKHVYTPAKFISEFRQYIKNPDVTDEQIFAAFLGTN
jgi:ATPase family associated with various cellular activities (AAA)